MTGPRGRRPGESSAREDILVAARAQFAASGFQGATLRQIADAAGVNVRLVSHYYGSKADLFVAAVALPIDPSAVFDQLLAEGREGLGGRVALVIIARVLELPEAREVFTGMIRAAASEDDAAVLVRERLVQQILLPIAERIGSDHAELRASLMGSQIAGLVLARYIIGIPELAATDPRRLAAMVGPVLDHYLFAPIPQVEGPVGQALPPSREGRGEPSPV